MFHDLSLTISQPGDPASWRLRRLAQRQTARKRQARFFPPGLPLVAGLDYCGSCHTATAFSGDFFDFRSPARDRLDVLVGDVSGSEIGAAILKSGIQAFLRGLATRGSGPIQGDVEELSRLVYDLAPDDSRATLFYARLDSRSGELSYVSAGHEPPLLFRGETSRAQRLDRTGTVLGLSGHAVYSLRRVYMEPGDVLVAFTDGVTEARDTLGREWGENGIHEVFRRCRAARSSELVVEILESASRFANPLVPVDDRTVVVVRLRDTMRRTLHDEESAGLALTAA
ncbi:MAG TPA: PP2C family protein-serine/threonine phosphatase [Candidatus Acidoferrales bacterium]|nr:PP2C family protein-serine/threonine phosphatase [Candidatus Acidoferrales bacterium]